MHDFDLAELYGVEVRDLNKAVKRNLDRFPEDFMFKLTPQEWQVILNQLTQSFYVNTVSSLLVMMEFPIIETEKYLPNAFTVHGIFMLSGILRSRRAIQMNIAIMCAFEAGRKKVLLQPDFRMQPKLFKESKAEHYIFNLF